MEIMEAIGKLEGSHIFFLIILKMVIDEKRNHSERKNGIRKRVNELEEKVDDIGRDVKEIKSLVNHNKEYENGSTISGRVSEMSKRSE